MAITKKDLIFLENLEIRLQAQAQNKTKNIKDKMLISQREFTRFYNIIEKIENDFKKNREIAKNRNAEKRKNDPTYRLQLRI